MDTTFIMYCAKLLLGVVASLSVLGMLIYYHVKRHKDGWYVYVLAIASLASVVYFSDKLQSCYHYYKFWNLIMRSPRPVYITDLRLSPAECIKDFKEIKKVVALKYQPVANHKHIDLDALNVEFEPRVAKVKDAQEYGMLLMEYFSRLQNMHTHPYFKSFLSGVTLVSCNDNVWVHKSPDRLDLQEKDLILAVNGTPVADVIKRNIKTTIASNEASRTRFAATNVLSSYTDSLLLATIQRGDSVFDVEIPLYRKVVDKSKSLVTAGVGQDSCFVLPEVVKCLKDEHDIGFIQIPAFQKGSDTEVAQLLDSVRNCSSLILSVEGNPGGVAKYVGSIAAHFIDRDKYFGRFKVVRDSAYYHGDIYLLMDEVSSSGAEMLVGLLKGQSNVTVIGRHTNGDCGSAGYNFKTTHGVEFRVAAEAPFLLADSVCYSEGEGISPDIEMPYLLPWEKGERPFMTAFKLIHANRLGSE